MTRARFALIACIGCAIAGSLALGFCDDPNAGPILFGVAFLFFTLWCGEERRL